MAGFVELLVIFALDFAIGFRRDDGGFSCGCKRLQHTSIRIICLIGNYYVRFNIRQQRISADQIMRLSRRQEKPCGIAERITGGMNLRGQPAFTSPDCL